jgi:uncharacterized protein YaeQ
MALSATIYHWQITLSDVDRQVYESLDLRLARHPSESARFLVTRVLAYCLSYEDGIVFSRGGLSDAEEPPVSIVDSTGVRTAWIDVGAPSAERLHKASKATPRVSLFTHVDLALLQREAATRAIHKVEAIDVWRVETALLDAVDAKLDRNAKLEIVRTDGQLYVTIGGDAIEGAIERVSLSVDRPR